MTLSKSQAARLRQIVRGRGDMTEHVLEGPKAIVDALSLGVVRSLWVADDVRDDVRETIESAARAQDIDVQQASRNEMDRVSETVTSSGVLAIVRDTSTSWEQLRQARGPLVWLDGVQDPGNVGAIFRIVAAFSVSACVVTEGTAYPLGAKALRASAGLALHVPFARANRSEVLDDVASASRDLWITDAGGESVFEAPSLPGNALLVVGSEARGAHEAVVAAATRIVSVPIAPHVESLNAAVAAGIVIATLHGNRGSKRS